MYYLGSVYGVLAGFGGFVPNLLKAFIANSASPHKSLLEVFHFLLVSGLEVVRVRV